MKVLTLGKLNKVFRKIFMTNLTLKDSENNLMANYLKFNAKNKNRMMATYKKEVAA